MQAVTAHTQLLKRGGYTPLQLFFGYELAPVEGEAPDPEQKGRRVTVIAQMLTCLQSAMKARLQAKSKTPTHTVHAMFGLRSSCLSQEADILRMRSLPVVKQGFTAMLNKSKGLWLGPAVVLAQERGRNHKPTEQAHGISIRQNYPKKSVSTFWEFVNYLSQKSLRYRTKRNTPTACWHCCASVRDVGQSETSWVWSKHHRGLCFEYRWNVIAQAFALASTVLQDAPAEPVQTPKLEDASRGPLLFVGASLKILRMHPGGWPLMQRQKFIIPE